MYTQEQVIISQMNEGQKAAGYDQEETDKVQLFS